MPAGGGLLYIYKATHPAAAPRDAPHHDQLHEMTFAAKGYFWLRAMCSVGPAVTMCVRVKREFSTQTHTHETAAKLHPLLLACVPSAREQVKSKNTG
jgi:hypothetical protein